MDSTRFDEYPLLLLAFLVPILAAASAHAQQPAPPWYADKTELCVYIDAVGASRPVTTAGEWSKRREHILAAMQLVMGPLPELSRLSQTVPLDVQTVEEVKLPGLVRRKITFAVEAGDRLPAYLLLPDGAAGKRPAVLCLHPTSHLGKDVVVGLGGKSDRAYALELARRGYVTLAPDYPNMGEYKFDAYGHGYASATMKAIVNHARAVDLLQSLPEVDPDRIGCIGHSLGGHNTLFLAVFDQRVKVVVTSCGFNSFPKYYGGDLTGWSHAGYMPRIASQYGKDPRRMPFDFTEVLAALSPRPLFVNAPLRDDNFAVSGVKDCIAAATPVYALFGAKDLLVAMYPDAEHDFPDAARRAAYEFIDRALGKR